MAPRAPLASVTRRVVIRISKSNSGITKDNKKFVIVYRLDDGSLSPPIVVKRKEAIAVATKYRDHQMSDRAKKINASAARYVMKKAIQHGWIDDVNEAPDSNDSDESFGSSVVESQSETRTFDAEREKANAKPSPSPKPKFFPKIDPYSKSTWDSEMTDDLAFVLSGVNPEKRRDASLVASGMTLVRLFRTPEHRVSAIMTLRPDHRYTLAHLHSMDEQQFQDTWDLAKESVVGQDATDLLKLRRAFVRFPVDGSGESLKDVNSRDKLLAIRDGAVALLTREFRSVRRKIDEIHTTQPADNATDANKPNAWLRKIGLKGRKKDHETPDQIPVLEAVSKLADGYLQFSVKLGRILRCDLVRRAR